MLIKILILVFTLLLFLLIGYSIFKKKIRPYHALTWALVEGFWYVVSFLALCVGLVELERIEKLNEYKTKEKLLSEDYDNKKSLLYAQSWILRLDHDLPEKEKEGVLWFHKMRAYFEEGMNSPRWEAFLLFSRNFVHNEKRSEYGGRALEFGWPLDFRRPADSLYLKDEIMWMQDTLSSFMNRRESLQKIKPEENTNYQVRYFLIAFFLLALALKFLKIHADYIRNRNSNH